MKAHLALFLAALLLTGCSKQQRNEDQAGAAQASNMDVLAGDRGYIIENARFAGTGDAVLYRIGDGFKLTTGTSGILVIREQEREGSPGYILALQFPVFAAGTTKDYGDDPESAQFWLVTSGPGGQKVTRTGVISGSIRFVKKSPADLDLGLNRQITNGVGDVEIVVANIRGEGVATDATKKFNARFILPIVTLEEMAKISRPA
ncbi:MAG: hypothetical protein QHI48_07155 [Bacteroidota bacterium]|nr:hypothetical protein [Bacteroidota bacterium]